jgi:hypothetical protein
MINWPAIAPATEPHAWNPADPADPHYDWSVPDASLRAIEAAGLEPLAIVASAPTWARILPGFASSAPDAPDFAKFVQAAATRYDGRHPGLPRVKYWRIWNEPNISAYFRPQFDAATKRFTSPDIYRGLVNQAAAVIHAAAPGNRVIAGGLSPFSDPKPDVRAVDPEWGPLKFMRRLLCVDDDGNPTCSNRVSFDIWSTHPYTTGGPTHHATLPYDVSLGDLPKMRATLTSTVRAGHVASRDRVRFWVTEFAWDSNGPDICAVPLSLLERWVPEALYRMWAAGVEHVSWFKLIDQPVNISLYQSGLYFASPVAGAAAPKPFLEGLRFPFVALRHGSRVLLWARAPSGRSGRVTIQQTFKGGWTTIRTLRSDRFGIVHRVVVARPTGSFRAVSGRGERSLPFSMRVPPDQFFRPFGATVLSPKRSDCVA